MTRGECRRERTYDGRITDNASRDSQRSPDDHAGMISGRVGVQRTSKAGPSAMSNTVTTPTKTREINARGPVTIACCCSAEYHSSSPVYSHLDT